MSTPLKLGFIASHTGSSMMSILDAIRLRRLDADPKVVISNNADAPALDYAARHGVPTVHLSAKTEGSIEAADRAIADCLDRFGVNLVVLSGYLRKVGPETLRRYPGKILNIHPSLLPKHGGRGMYGQAVHESVLESGDKVSGATVHLVDDEYDHGAIIRQRTVPVLKGDTVENLKERVMAIEPDLYIATLQDIRRNSRIIPSMHQAAYITLREWKFGHGAVRQSLRDVLQTKLAPRDSHLRPYKRAAQ